MKLNIVTAPSQNLLIKAEDGVYLKINVLPPVKLVINTGTIAKVIQADAIKDARLQLPKYVTITGQVIDDTLNGSWFDYPDIDGIPFEIKYRYGSFKIDIIDGKIFAPRLKDNITDYGEAAELMYIKLEIIK